MTVEEVFYDFNKKYGDEFNYIFHLTYSEENADGFPESKRFEDIMAVKEYIEQLFLTEYRNSRYIITIDGERFS